MNAIDVRGVNELAARLRGIGEEAPKAVLRAARRTRTTVMSRLARVVAQASGLPQKRIRRSLHGSQPTLADPKVEITLWGGRARLVDYKGSARSESLPTSAFRARMPRSGHVGFFERRPGQGSLKQRPGRAKATRIRPGVWHALPIDEVYGSPFTRFVTAAALAEILKMGGETFRANLERELAFRESRRSVA